MIDSKNDTNGQELHVFKLQLGDSASVVKSASVEDQAEQDALESRHFANPVDRVFPIHTKEATERSIVYFFGNAFNNTYDSAYPASGTEDRLKKAARFWNTTDAFYAVKRACVCAQEIDALPTETLAYALPGNRLPISTPDQILKSAAALIEQRDRVTFSRRSEAALKILKAAAEQDVDDERLETHVGDLQKIAGLHTRSRKDITELLAARGEFYEGRGIDAEVYKSASQSIRTCEDSDIDTLCGLLDAFEHAEKAAKVKVGPIEDVFYDEVPEQDYVKLASGDVLLYSVVKKAGLMPFYALGESVPLNVTDAGGRLDLCKAASFLECVPKADCLIYLNAVSQCLK